MSIEDLKTRLMEIAEEQNQLYAALSEEPAPEGEDVPPEEGRASLDEIETRANALIEERKSIESQIAQAEKEAEERAEIAKKITAGTLGTVVEERKEDKEMEEKRYSVDSLEYRNAWLNKIRGIELNEVEERAFAANGSAIATMTANDIIDHVRENAPLLDKVSVVYSASQVSYYIEDTVNDAINHTENAAITAAADTLTKVTLNPSEIVKMIQISEAVKMMSVDAFAQWIAKNIGETIAAKINKAITSALITAAASAGTTYTGDSVRALLGAVKGDVTVVCSRKALYTRLLPIQDNSKSSIIKFDGGEAWVYGAPVLIDDSVPDTTVLAANLSKSVAAMAEQVTVREQYDINTNSYKYLGVALFDFNAGLGEAAKIVAAS